MALTKKGQVEITFNWIYILIAGTVILLFFVGLVYKQKAVSEEKLTIEVVEILDSILRGASVAEKTKNFVNTGGIAGYTLQFSCDEGVSNYGIKDSSFQEENAVTPIFSLPEIQSPRLIFWSLPYKLPYKIIDLLFITSANTNYVFLGANNFVNEFLDATTESDPFLKISTEVKQNIEEVTAGGNTYLRLIDVDGTHISENMELSANLKNLDEERITAVVFKSAQSVDFFIAQNGKWKKTNFNSINLVSLGGERDAAKYAAIFAGNDKIYECNMEKAFKRMVYLDEVYQGKVEDLVTFYQQSGVNNKNVCLTHLINAPEQNLRTLLGTHHARARSCVLGSNCEDLVEPSEKIITVNDNLESEGCVKLY